MVLLQFLEIIEVFGDYLWVEYLSHASIMPSTKRNGISEAAPELVAVEGVGTDTAASLLIAAGDNPERLENEAAFAHLCGAAPIPASSGKSVRHRLNRHGNRDARAGRYT